MSERLIEVKVSKAVLFLTEAEYVRALTRGKAIKRRRSLEKRIAPGQHLRDEATESFLRGYRQGGKGKLPG